MFEENLQLGNRPFYDLFAVVIGCGWSCAGSARLHGLFLISQAISPRISAFLEPHPLFSNLCLPQRWAPVAGCGIAGSAAASARARRPNLAPRPLRPGPRRCCLRSRRGARRAGSPEGARGAEAPTGAGFHRPPGSRRPAAGWPSRAVPTRGSFSNIGRSLPRRARE